MLKRSIILTAIMLALTLGRLQDKVYFMCICTLFLAIMATCRILVAEFEV